MRKKNFLLVFLILAFVFGNTAFAKKNLSDFMMSRDLLNQETTSNISLKNNRTTPVTVYGLYVRQFAYVNPGENCDSAIDMYPAENNLATGAFVMPVTIPGGQSAEIGANYLYNMLYQANYYIGIIHPFSPPGCALPGCTWGSDTSIYHWCIYLGALAPVSNSSDYSSTIPPSTELASNNAPSYNYNLINQYHYLGPIICNDQTLSCSATSKQIQSFS